MRRLAIALALFTTLCATGCGTVIKTAVNEARRSTGYATPLENIDGYALDDYSTVYVQPFSHPTGLGGDVVAAQAVPHLVTRLSETKFFEGVREGKAPSEAGMLQVRGEILSVYRTDARSTVIGPKQMMLVDVTLTDAATGRTVGRAHIMGLALAETSNKDELATQGVAKGVQSWLEEHHTPVKDD